MSDFEDALNSILSSPKDMEKIMGLAKELGGGGTEKKEKQEGSGIAAPMLDPKLLGVLSRIMGEFSDKGDDKAKLAEAMKPFLSEKRSADLERAVKIARIAKLAKTVLPELGGEFNL